MCSTVITWQGNQGTFSRTSTAEGLIQRTTKAQQASAASTQRLFTHQHSKELEQVAHAAVCLGCEQAPIVNVQVKLIVELVAVIHLGRARVQKISRCCVHSIAPVWLLSPLGSSLLLPALASSNTNTRLPRSTHQARPGKGGPPKVSVGIHIVGTFSSSPSC